MLTLIFMFYFVITIVLIFGIAADIFNEFSYLQIKYIIHENTEKYKSGIALILNFFMYQILLILLLLLAIKDIDYKPLINFIKELILKKKD